MSRRSKQRNTCVSKLNVTYIVFIADQYVQPTQDINDAQNSRKLTTRKSHPDTNNSLIRGKITSEIDFLMGLFHSLKGEKITKGFYFLMGLMHNYLQTRGDPEGMKFHIEDGIIKDMVGNKSHKKNQSKGGKNHMEGRVHTQNGTTTEMNILTLNPSILTDEDNYTIHTPIEVTKHKACNTHKRENQVKKKILEKKNAYLTQKTIVPTESDYEKDLILEYLTKGQRGKEKIDKGTHNFKRQSGKFVKSSARNNEGNNKLTRKLIEMIDKLFQKRERESMENITDETRTINGNEMSKNSRNNDYSTQPTHHTYQTDLVQLQNVTEWMEPLTKMTVDTSKQPTDKSLKSPKQTTSTETSKENVKAMSKNTRFSDTSEQTHHISLGDLVDLNAIEWVETANMTGGITTKEFETPLILTDTLETPQVFKPDDMLTYDTKKTASEEKMHHNIKKIFDMEEKEEENKKRIMDDLQVFKAEDMLTYDTEKKTNEEKMQDNIKKILDMEEKDEEKKNKIMDDLLIDENDYGILSDSVSELHTDLNWHHDFKATNEKFVQNLPMKKHVNNRSCRQDENIEQEVNIENYDKTLGPEWNKRLNIPIIGRQDYHRSEFMENLIKYLDNEEKFLRKNENYRGNKSSDNKCSLKTPLYAGLDIAKRLKEMEVYILNVKNKIDSKHDALNKSYNAYNSFLFRIHQANKTNMSNTIKTINYVTTNVSKEVTDYMPYNSSKNYNTTNKPSSTKNATPLMQTETLEVTSEGKIISKLKLPTTFHHKKYLDSIKIKATTRPTTNSHTFILFNFNRSIKMTTLPSTPNRAFTKTDLPQSYADISSIAIIQANLSPHHSIKQTTPSSVSSKKANLRIRLPIVSLMEKPIRKP